MPLFKRKKRSSIALENISDDIAPVKLGEIPEVAIALGMIRPDYYQVYKMCDGSKNIGIIAQNLNKDKIEVKEVIKKLYQMALVRI